MGTSLQCRLIFELCKWRVQNGLTEEQYCLFTYIDLAEMEEEGILRVKRRIKRKV